MRGCKACVVVALALLAASCSRPPPHEVTTIKTPQSDVHLTFEYWNLGVLVSDSARLVAHLVKDGVEDKAILIDGDYVNIRKITWPSPDTVVVCVTHMDQVHEWRREVTLRSGNTVKTLYVELRGAYVNDLRTGPGGTKREGFAPAPENNCPISALEVN